MGHTVRDKGKLLNRVRRLKGQVEAIERALEGEQGCTEVLQLIASTRGAMNGLMMEIIEGHVRDHVASPDIETALARQQGADELIEVLRTYLK
jgi:FrmR/RcnR family transcriptional regulator, repressor of frmRAB operon